MDTSPYVLKRSDTIVAAAAPAVAGADEKKRISLDDKEVPFSSSESKTPSTLEEAELPVGPVAIPWKWKILALCTVITLSFGQEWTDSAIGPLKNTLRNELRINNTQFALIDSASGIINCFWPVFGGMALDWFGVSTVSLMCTGFVLLGSIVAALGPTLGIWRMIVGGHIMIGFGSAVLDSAQHKLFYHWFGAGGLALAYGIETAVSKSTGLVSGISAIPIKEGTGWYGWSFWIPVVLCFISFSVNLVYVVVNKYWVPVEYRLTGARDAPLTPGEERKRFDFAAVFHIPWAFWILPMTQLFQSGAADAFGSSSSDLIRMKGYTEAVAAFTAQGGKVLPILLAPLIGMAVDRWGHRLHLTALAPLLWITALAIIGWSDVHPLLPVIIASLAGCINSFPFAVSMPLLLKDQKKLGTGFGIWRCFNNAGSTTLSIVYGIVQDNTENMAYTNVLKIGIGLKAWAFCLGLLYVFLDKKYWGSGLTMGEKQRVAREETIVDPESDPLTARPVFKAFTYIGIGMMVSMAVTCITMFVYYTS